MSRAAHVALMARYNTWMNTRLYAAADGLSAAELACDRGAFFGSLLGTLNHLAVADTIWLKRFAADPDAHAALEPVRALPMPEALDAVPFPEFASLSEQRRMLDAVIERWTESLDEVDLARPLRYRNTRGQAFERETFGLLMHLFNHQTHHRGQATTLLSQAGIDMGVTDLLALLPDLGAPAEADVHRH